MAANDAGEVAHMHSYSVPGRPDSLATMCKAIMATLAGSAFAAAASDPMCVLGAKAMACETANAASEIWCSDSSALKNLVICFIAIGAHGSNLEEDSLLDCPSKVPRESYFRFSVHPDNTSLHGMEEPREMAIEKATTEYMQQRMSSFLALIRSMMMKQSTPPTHLPARKSHGPTEPQQKKQILHFSNASR
jgi:hypothetical protein